jgi:hypothetical protein
MSGVDEVRIDVTASNVRPTDTGVRHGVDVDVTVAIDGRTMGGEVTLVPGDYDRTRYVAWGAPDNWVDSRLLAWLPDGRDALRECLDAIEAEASATAGTVQS